MKNGGENMTYNSENHQNKTEQIVEYDAVVVGAGFSGMYMLYRLRELGFNTRVFDGASGVGGTWYWNRYPGLRLDTECLYYSYTFSEDLYKGWTWTSRFAPQSELLKYANYVADKLELRKDIQFNTRVQSAHYDEANRKWNIRLSDGTPVIATYFITGVGALSTANVPKFKGLENFKGEWYHTGQWPHEPMDFKGKRVGIIGTGSSGAQLITALASEVAHMTVFQRTPQYITPAQNRLLDPDLVRYTKDNLQQIIQEMRTTGFGVPGVKTDRSLFEDTPEEQQRVLQAAWDAGAQAFALATYKDLNTSEEANKVAADFVRAKIRKIVKDPKVAEKLMPTYYFGTKRPVKVDNYYETFNRENVLLVDVKNEEPIIEITEKGVRTTKAEYELDAILFATGFDAITGSLFKIDIRGKEGVTLKEKWEDGAQVKTYLGLGTNGFPNMFTITGPQSPSVSTNLLFNIQEHCEWIANCINYLKENGIEAIEANEDAQEKWVNHVNELAMGTLLPKTESWWTGANIAEKTKPDNFLFYIDGVQKYGEIIRDVVAKGYEGFELVSSSQKTPV